MFVLEILQIFSKKYFCPSPTRGPNRRPAQERSFPHLHGKWYKKDVAAGKWSVVVLLSWALEGRTNKNSEWKEKWKSELRKEGLVVAFVKNDARGVK